MQTTRFNTAIARITESNNAITARWAAAGTVPREIAEPLTLVLAPLAPHIAEQLWSRLGHSDPLTWTPYPRADPDRGRRRGAGAGQREGPSRHRPRTGRRRRRDESRRPRRRADSTSAQRTVAE